MVYMKAIAKASFIRMSPRKLRLVADVVRGMDAETALTHLRFMRKRAVLPLSKTVRQALANAKQLGLSSPLKITQLMINKGPVYKRFRAVSRGQAHGVEKKTAHIVVELESKLKANSE
jgi:large subunit ribosomal protein L22